MLVRGAASGTAGPVVDREQKARQPPIGIPRIPCSNRHRSFKACTAIYTRRRRRRSEPPIVMMGTGNKSDTQNNAESWGQESHSDMTPKQNESGVFLNMPENNEVFATNDNNDVTTKQTSHDQDTSARPSGSLLRRLLVAFIIGAGVLIPLAIAGLVAVGQIPPHVWKVFVCGTALGALWELPLMAPMHTLPHQLRSPTFLLWLALWSAWDGLVCLLVVFGVCLIVPGLHFQTPDLVQGLALVIIAQVQSLVVEVLACAFDLWSYKPGPRCWRLFTVKEGRDITTTPQLIWLAASGPLYQACLSASWPGL